MLCEERQPYQDEYKVKRTAYTKAMKAYMMWYKVKRTAYQDEYEVNAEVMAKENQWDC